MVKSKKMKKIRSLLIFILLMIISCSEPEYTSSMEENISNRSFDRSFNFENLELNTMPSGWSNFVTGRGGPGKWEIRKDNGNSVLAQVSKRNSGSHFDVIVLNGYKARNLEISVRFKGVEGKEDRGGGPVWRYQDHNNYYIARANPLENNFRVYRVLKGKRIRLAGAKIKIPSGEWHTITIKVRGDRIECFYDGRKYLNVTDTTFMKEGMIGLWIKADAVTYFDELKFRKLL